MLSVNEKSEMQKMITPTPPQVSIADLERLAAKLALTHSDSFPDDDDYSSVNARRVMYRFWLRTDNEQEQALMQWLDIMKHNRKFQTFVKMALRAAILEAKERYEYSDDLFLQIEEMFDKMDWSRK